MIFVVDSARTLLNPVAVEVLLYPKKVEAVTFEVEEEPDVVEECGRPVLSRVEEECASVVDNGATAEVALDCKGYWWLV